MTSDSMLAHYRRSLTDLFSQVRFIKEDPYGHREECLHLQESLIKKMTYVERRTRKLKSAVTTLKRKLRTQRLSKEEAKELKSEISRQQSRRDEYRYVLRIFRDVGDAIAFTYIDRWDIKPLAFKESPGFISGKKGARRERGIWRSVFNRGMIAILNDLTNCLRYGDVTILRPDGTFVIAEVKSSEQSSGRVERQIGKLERIVDYISTDRMDGLYQLAAEVHRLPLHSREITYRDEMNQVIRTALEQGSCLLEVERGLFYFAATLSGYDPRVLNPLIRRQQKGELWLADISTMGNTGYYPFTLSIYDPHALYMFYEGTLVIMVMVERGIVVKKLQSQGLTVDFLSPGDDWGIEVSSIGADSYELDRMRVSNHLLRRVFAEFLSLDWFLENMIIERMRDPHIAKLMNHA